jgi:2-polyprenyl-3-methyl-5-hydroxy-6-metoxy-1,4-benzoquinol methylase
MSGTEKSNSNDPSSDLRTAITTHFDEIAPRYDLYKDRSEYYYSQLQRLLSELLPAAHTQRILEIGCGTGSLLAALNPQRGLGVDISREMIRLARERWVDRPELRFETGEAEELTLTDTWDVVIMVDVLEHLYDVRAAIGRLGEQLSPRTLMIQIWANRLWTPILHILEMLKMKMPEGPHKWESLDIILQLLTQSGFTKVNSGTRCLIPARLPGSDWINSRYHSIFGLKRLGLIQFLTVKRD